MDIGTKNAVWIKERYNSKIREFGRVTKSENAEFEEKAKECRRALAIHIIILKGMSVNDSIRNSPE